MCAASSAFAAERIDTAGAVDDSHCAVAGVRFGLEPAGPPEGPLAVGDALGMIPPFTGHGMAMALQSAEIALPHLLAYARGECPWREAHAAAARQLRSSFARRMRAATTLHPLLTTRLPQQTLAWLARARAVPFGALYRLTHGGPRG
jgi:flavin-dependent dehydrogenase